MTKTTREAVPARPYNLKAVMAAHKAVLKESRNVTHYSRMVQESEVLILKNVRPAPSIDWEKRALREAVARRDSARADFDEAAAVLGEMIKAVEGRATARTITPDSICIALEDVEDRLAIPRRALEGVRVNVDPNAQSFPNAYKYTPESTQFEAVFKGGSWRVTRIYRDECRRPNRAGVIELTDAAKAEIIARAGVIAH